MKDFGPQQRAFVTSAMTLVLALTWIHSWPNQPVWGMIVVFLAVLFAMGQTWCRSLLFGTCLWNSTTCSCSPTVAEKSTVDTSSFPTQLVVLRNLLPPPPTTTFLSTNVADTQSSDFPHLVGLDAKEARQQLLLSNFPRYRNIEIYPEGARMTEDKQFYRLRMIVDKRNKVKRIYSMV